ncbi:MAG: VacJ family lipoprotein [Pseudomonadales bacterium]|nr:VacJ family lipoprotein [Pseudomonadales bacterium]
MAILAWPCLVFADDSRDPWAGFNRPVYRFNDTLDRYILRPVAHGYVRVTPQLAQQGIHNFFSNLGDVLVVLNDVLQAKPDATGRDFLRFVINSTWGVAGFIDVGTRVGLPKHNQDLGITLGVWGVPAGPYVVLPFWGPSTLRDAPASLVSTLLYPINFLKPARDQWGPDMLMVVDDRAQLLPLQATLDSSGDPYSLLREVYLQRRDSEIRGPSAQDPFTDDDTAP